MLALLLAEYCSTQWFFDKCLLLFVLATYFHSFRMIHLYILMYFFLMGFFVCILRRLLGQRGSLDGCLVCLRLDVLRILFLLGVFLVFLLQSLYAVGILYFFLFFLYLFEHIQIFY